MDRELLVRLQKSLSTPINSVNRNEESEQINKLCSQIGNSSDFSNANESEGLYKEILETLFLNRLCLEQIYEKGDMKMDWLNGLGQLGRVLLRDSNLQQLISNDMQLFVDVYGQESIRLYFSSVVLGPMEISAVTSFLRSFLSCAQKLCLIESCCNMLCDASLQKLLICLLSVKDMVIIQAALQLLTKLCEASSVAREHLLAASCIDQCLQLLRDADLLSQKLGCGLMRVLCSEDEAREQIKVYDGVPTILGLLCTRNVRLQWHVVWTLAQLAEDEEISYELFQCGALNIILAEIGDMRENNVNSLEDWFSMLSGLSAILAQMCQLDSIALAIVQENGIYIICKPLLAQLDHPEWKNNRTYCLLLCGLFRVLRLIFSLERNRPLFKRIFPADLLSVFIDVGHYNLDIAAYESVVKKFTEIMDTDGEELQGQIESANQRRVPAAFIGQYAIIDQLGAGAFGCVYKVKRKTSAPSSSDKDQYYALKEIFMHQSSLGKDASAPGKSFGDIISEVKIIKQQMRHPNVVRYRKVFVEGEKLYILMDLIEGVSLKEHIISLNEKNTRFAEERIWNIIIQIVLALRYLHKEKKIIHRDLKPNNIMLDDQDKVVITDFGLAKRREESYLKSTAGTVLYSCPEIVQNFEYGEKADVWSLGCVIYEMGQLTPPFFSSNMLHLAKAIVDADYSPIEPADLYSQDLTDIISGCLTAEPNDRLDIVQVANKMTSRLLIYIDNMQMVDKRRESVKPYGSTNMLESSLNVSGQSWASSSGIFPSSVVSNRTASSSMSMDSPKSVSPLVPVHRENAMELKSLITTPVPESNERPTRQKTRRGRDGPMKSAGPSVLPQSRIPRSHSVDSSNRRSKSAVLPAIHTKPLPDKLNKKIAWQTDSSFQSPVILPTIRRTNSTSLIEAQQTFNQPLRVLSAGSLVAVSTSKVKAINDPILELLDILHKIVYINQLAPLSAKTEVDHRRRVLDQFQRNLFAKDSSPTNIKAELRKLSSQSPDPVSIKLGYGDFRPVLQALPFEFTVKTERISSITYEQLYACMEAILQEQSTVAGNRIHHRPESRLFTPAGGGRD